MWLQSWISLFFTSPHFIPYPLIGGENKVCGIKSSGATNKSVNQNKFLHLITKVQSWKRFQFSHVHATIILTCFSLLVHMTTNCPLAVLLVARGDWFGQPTLMSLLLISYWFFSAYLFYSSVFDIYCITTVLRCIYFFKHAQCCGKDPRYLFLDRWTQRPRIPERQVNLII